MAVHMEYFRPKMSGLIFWKGNRNSETTIRLLVFTFGILVVGAAFIIWMLVGGAANVNWWKPLG